jgi:hypothetical protein
MSLVKTLIISVALLGGGILVLKNLEAKTTCPPGKYKNAAGVCACAAGYKEVNGVCKVIPKSPVKPPANNNDDDDDDDDDNGNGNGGNDCPASAERACELQNDAFGTLYDCEVNDNCTCVCQRKANRAVVAANRVMLKDYYRNRMDAFDYANKIYRFNEDEDYRYSSYAAFSDPESTLYSYTSDGNTIPTNRENMIADNAVFKFANVVG